MSTSSGAGAERLGASTPTTPTTAAYEPIRPEYETAAPAREVRQETLVQSPQPPDPAVNVALGPERRDRVRWGPVWAGLIVALPTFFLIELAFFALGWLTLDPGANEPGTTAGWISGLIGLFAFFLGGLTAGATAMWRGASDGLLHGILVWALGVVAVIFVSVFGGGALFGSVANVLARVAALQQANLPNVNAAQALDAARHTAAWAVLGLGLSIIASSIGGVIGAKMWPAKRDSDRRVVDVS